MSERKSQRKKQQKGFNLPFADLRRRLPAEPKVTPPAPAPQQEKRDLARDAHQHESSEECFRRAMAGVKPLPHDHRRPFEALRQAASSPPGAPAAARRPPTVQAGFRVRPAEDGDGLEGRAAGTNDLQLRALRQGGLDVEASIDLHGCTAAAAEVRLRAFLERCQARAVRCALVVHGRGLNSGQTGPVLRGVTHDVLAEQGRAGQIAAFAPAADGHGGATIVLMKRSRHER